ncbi:MAG: ribosome biogenesis GTP-binding protein YihA/YsxC [Thermodesulfobacteriota bacterium]
MIIKSATFVTSAVKPAQYPGQDLPEIAFAGRSNVGKSSLINRLVNRRNLVKTSSTPGKTRLINFFNIDDRMLFVDLPGYGYAKVSHAEQKTWGPMVETYLTGRTVLKGAALLLDLRRQPREDEFMLLDLFSRHAIPYIIVLTKADKLKKAAQKEQRRAIASDFGLDENDLILFSAKSGLGKEDILTAIEELTENDQEKIP